MINLKPRLSNSFGARVPTVSFHHSNEKPRYQRRVSANSWEIVHPTPVASPSWTCMPIKAGTVSSTVLAEYKNQGRTNHFLATRTKCSIPQTVRTCLTRTVRSSFHATAWSSRVSRCRQPRFRPIARWSCSRSRKFRDHMRFKIRMGPPQLLIILFLKLIRLSHRNRRVKGTHKLYSRAMFQQLHWIATSNTIIARKFNSSTAFSHSKAGRRSESKIRRRNPCWRFLKINPRISHKRQIVHIIKRSKVPQSK